LLGWSQCHNHINSCVSFAICGKVSIWTGVQCFRRCDCMSRNCGLPAYCICVCLAQLRAATPQITPTLTSWPISTGRSGSPCLTWLGWKAGAAIYWEGRWIFLPPIDERASQGACFAGGCSCLLRMRVLTSMTFSTAFIPFSNSSAAWRPGGLLPGRKDPGRRGAKVAHPQRGGYQAEGQRGGSLP